MYSGTGLIWVLSSFRSRAVLGPGIEQLVRRPEVIGMRVNIDLSFAQCSVLFIYFYFIHIASVTSLLWPKTQKKSLTKFREIEQIFDNLLECNSSTKIFPEKNRTCFVQFVYCSQMHFYHDLI